MNFQGKCKFVILTAIFFAAFSINAGAQTLLVNYAFNDAAVGTPCDGGTSNASGGVTATFTTGNAGACTTPAGAATTAGAFTQNTAGTAVSINGFANGATNYFQFQLSGVSSFQNYQVYFQAVRSGTGPTNADLQYSLDGTNFTTIQSVQINATPTAYNLDLSAVTAINNQPNVYLRLVGTTGSGGAGTFRIDNFQAQALRPTAAGANISGRVLTASGRGTANSTLMLTGNSQGEPLYAKTNAFGYYHFNNLSAGETYVISITSKSYKFNNPSQVISLNDNVTGADFTANR